ncbi:MAG: sigma-70 family RNA polymerase sigma factor [Pirellula sp.]|jgi:RNA polymerase sigma-70 factor (ECF subfamily)|nr:sigma-70 family RNA polymerase sigma factor [Pirellula sp.]
MHPVTLQELFAELSNALVLYARGWCKNPEDAVQEAFIDLANCHPEPTSPKAWLYTTTRRKAQNLARTESRRRNHLEQMIQQSTADRAGEYWSEPNTVSGVAASDVLEGLESLKPDQREMIIAKVWGELTFEELAELMNCSPASAHRRYITALTDLKHSVLAGSESKNHVAKLGTRP